MGKLKDGLAVVWRLGNATLDEYSKDRGDLLAAAVAFHTLLSMAPLIIVAVALAGVVLGRGAAHAEVVRVLGDTLGPTGAATVDEWVTQASQGSEVASVVGVVLTLVTASRLGTQLRDALNHILDIDVYLAVGFRSTIKDYVRRRIFAFALVAASGPLLLIVFASRTLLTHFHTALFGNTPWQGLAIQVLQVSLSLTIVGLISSVIFRYVPDTRVAWRNALVGGAATSLLFNAGNVIVGVYLGRTSVAAAYGAAGSAIIVLLWLYYSSHMLLLGAEFAQVFARHYGSGLSPEEKRELARARQRGRAELAREGVEPDGAAAGGDPLDALGSARPPSKDQTSDRPPSGRSDSAGSASSDSV